MTNSIKVASASSQQCFVRSLNQPEEGSLRKTPENVFTKRLIFIFFLYVPKENVLFQKHKRPEPLDFLSFIQRQIKHSFVFHAYVFKTAKTFSGDFPETSPELIPGFLRSPQLLR